MRAQIKAPASRRRIPPGIAFSLDAASMAARCVQANYAAPAMPHKSTRSPSALSRSALPEAAPLDSFTLPATQGYCHDRLLCVDQPERAENLHYAGRDEAALQGAFRRRVEGRPVRSEFRQDQSEFKNSGDHRPRWPRRQADYGF